MQIDMDSELTLAGLCMRAAMKYDRRAAFEIFKRNNLSALTSYRLLGIRARQFASLLGRLGVKAGDNALILAENRPEWPAAWFGIALAGAVSVPVADDPSGGLVRHVMEQCAPAAVCVSRQCFTQLEGIDPAIPVILIDSVSGAEKTDISVLLNGVIKKLPLEDAGVGAVSRAGTGGGFPPVTVSPDDPAVIFYEGIEPENLTVTRFSGKELILRAREAAIKLFPRDRLLSTIPLSHAFECTRGLLRAVTAGATTVYLDSPPSPRELIPAAQALKPTVMLALPSLVEDFRRDFIEPVLKADPLYRYALTRPLAYRKAGKKLLAALGKLIRCLEINGALPAEVEEFLRRIHFPHQTLL